MRELNRRSFLAGGSSLLAASAFAAEAAMRLRAETRVIEVNGKAATVLGLRGPSGHGGLRLATGERFNVEVLNGLREPTLVHWHGLTPPSPQDGVPMLSQTPLAPGGSQVYDFENRRTGTHWMHSHVGLQEQRLLAAPLIVSDPANALADEQEHVVMLHDFTFRDPDEILQELRAGRGAHAAMGHATLNDVAFDAYLCNDRTLADPEIVRVERGGRLRLRIINGCAASNMWVELGALAGELIAVDGNAVEAVQGSRFPLAIAQRADILVALPGFGAWPVLFQSEGVSSRTGLILATAGASIAEIGDQTDAAGAVDLTMESRLRAAKPPGPDPIVRTEVVTLTGGGADYSWGLNGKPSMHDTVFSVRPGERIEIILHNTTQMSHPMHLHGHHFQVVAINGQRFAGALRDTVLVPPGATVSIVFDADNPGTWAFHCHHLYHMNAGMMGAVSYTSAA